MAWGALYNTTTGELVSIAEAFVNPLPSGTAVRNLAGQPRLQNVMWDTATRAFVARPPRGPRVRPSAMIVAEPEIASMTQGTRDTIVAVVNRIEQAVQRA